MDIVAEGLRLSSAGYQRYKGEYDGKKVHISASDEVQHGSYDSGQRQRRSRSWVVKVDGAQVGSAPTLREAKEVAMVACRPAASTGG